MPAKRNLLGCRFGRLVATEEVKERRNGLITWSCSCDCGGSATALAKTLLNGRTRSCGCLGREASRKTSLSMARPIGFERVTTNGYVEIKTERGFKRKHIHLMELHIGRPLFPDEVVHHRDEDRKNNNISNLELMTNSAHTTLHNLKRGKNGKRK